MKFSQPISFETARTRDGIIFCNAISFSDDLPFSEARLLLEIKTLLPTNLTSAELREIPSEILERALFSARVASADMLQSIADELHSYFKGEVNLSTARLNLQSTVDMLDPARMNVPESDRGTLRDIGSDARINLIINTNAATGRGYGQFVQGQKSLYLAPAWELYRAFARKVPRNWIQRFTSVGGKLREGKLVALKNDPIWDRLGSSFTDAIGNPYPPFAFNSGMRWRSVDRASARRMKLIEEDTQIEPKSRGFNEDLKASPDVRDRALRQVLEEEGYQFQEGVLTL